MNSRKKLVIISIISIIGIFILALATSYALFTINVTKNRNFKVAVGNLELSLNDTNQGNAFDNGKIVVSNMVPMRDSTGMEQVGYSFTLTNTGTIDASYSIFIDDVVLAELPSGTDGRLDNSLVRVNLTNITNNTTNTYTLSQINNRLLETGILNVGNSNSYVLRMWLDYTAGNDAQNKYYATKIRVDSVQKNSILTPGLYDSNNNLLASWDSLVNDYGLDVEKDYSPETDFDVDTSTGVSYIFKTNSILGAILVNNSNLATGSHLIIGDDVTKIGEAALLTNPGFSIIDCPSSVTEIGSMAFFGTSVVNYSGSAVDSENLNWGADVINPYIEGDFAYSDSTKTTLVAYLGTSSSVVIPSGVTTIESGSFDFLTNLKSVTIPASVVEIKESAFAYSGLETVTLEENSSLSKVEEFAFYNTPWCKNGPVYLNGIEVKNEISR